MATHIESWRTFSRWNLRVEKGTVAEKLIRNGFKRVTTLPRSTDCYSYGAVARWAVTERPHKDLDIVYYVLADKTVEVYERYG